jgi:hypothetical protein
LDLGEFADRGATAAPSSHLFAGRKPKRPSELSASDRSGVSRLGKREKVDPSLADALAAPTRETIALIRPQTGTVL